jgi:hypothetical protein
MGQTTEGSPVKRAASAALALAIALPPASASAAPMGPGVEPARVLSLEADVELEVVAKTMTNALRQRVLDAPEFALNALSETLVGAAYAAKCPIAKLRKPVVASNDRVFDATCLKRMSARLETKRFFWGLVYVEGTTTFIRLHFWQDGQDSVATLPYDEAKRERVAERLYRKLVTPDKVGDVTVSGLAEGELFVDGRATGPYASGDELTLSVGDRELEVRQGPRVVARGRASVTPGSRTEARLEAVAAPEPPPTQPFVIPPSIVVRPRASAWPWVLGSVSVAGFAGAGVFFALRQGVKSDLEKACFESDCLDDQRDDIRRGNLYSNLAAVSLGVGAAAGTGLVIYLLTPRKPPSVTGSVVPLAGGAAASLSGSFLPCPARSFSAPSWRCCRWLGWLATSASTSIRPATVVVGRAIRRAGARAAPLAPRAPGAPAVIRGALRAMPAPGAWRGSAAGAPGARAPARATVRARPTRARARSASAGRVPRPRTRAARRRSSSSPRASRATSTPRCRGRASSVSSTRPSAPSSPV